MMETMQKLFLAFSVFATACVYQYEYPQEVYVASTGAADDGTALLETGSPPLADESTGHVGHEGYVESEDSSNGTAEGFPPGSSSSSSGGGSSTTVDGACTEETQEEYQACISEAGGAPYAECLSVCDEEGLPFYPYGCNSGTDPSTQCDLLCCSWYCAAKLQEDYALCAEEYLSCTTPEAVSQLYCLESCAYETQDCWVTCADGIDSECTAEDLRCAC